MRYTGPVWRMRWNGGAAACLAAVVGAPLAMPLPAWAQTFAVDGVDELAAVLADAAPGTVVELAPGDYGMLRVEGGGGAEGQPITLRSADQGNPAVFGLMDMRGVQNVVLDGLTFDYRFQPEDANNLRPFQIIGGGGIEIRNAIFDGDIAAGLSVDANGYPTGFGLSVRGVQGFTLADSEVRNFLRGVVVAESEDVTVTGNDLHSLRSDGLNFASVQRVRVEGNMIRDFLRAPNSTDHPDMIQFWTNGTERPSTDIVIRDNVLNSGLGLYTQSIFMRNEAVDTGLAGSEMFYRNILIEENVIVNAHLHGITVGEAEGLVIRNNTVLHNAVSDGAGKRTVYIPQLRVAEAARNVRITGNVVSKIEGFADQPDWVVEENLLVQDREPTLPGFYDDVFVAARLGDPRNLASFAYLPGGPLDGAAIGASRLAGDIRALAAAAPQGAPLIRVITDPGLINRYTFDASMNALPDGVSPEDVVYDWDFGDVGTAQGPTVTMDFRDSGMRDVALTMRLPDGSTRSAATRVTIIGPNVVRFDGETVTGWRDGSPQEVPGLVEGGVNDVGQGKESAAVPRELMAGFFGSTDFRIDLRTRAVSTRGSAGELFRIHNSLYVHVSSRGSLEVQFSPRESEIVTFRSRPMGLTSTEWRDYSIVYSAAAGRIWVESGGEVMGQRSATGPVRLMESWGLTFGNPFGNKKSFDGQVARFVLSANNERYALVN